MSTPTSTIVDATAKLSIIVQSDDTTFNRHDARRAAELHVADECNDGGWDYWDIELENYDRYRVTFRRCYPNTRDANRIPAHIRAKLDATGRAPSCATTLDAHEVPYAAVVQ